MTLPTASDNEFPKVILEEVANDGSATVTPAADHRALFLGEDGDLHLKDSAAAVTDVGGGAPDAHAASHQNGGADEVSVAGLSGLLADDQNPTAHAADHQNGGGDEISVAGLSGLLADDQNPTAHAADHQSGGGDAIKLDDLAAPDDNTDLNVSITKHGLTPKLPNDATKYLDGAGAYTVPAGGGGGSASDDLKQRANTYVLELDWLAGTYQDGGIAGQAHSTMALAASRMYFTPIYVPKAITVDRIGINVSANSGAGEACRLGIYESGADGMPGALLLDAGEVAVTTNGGKEITISQALSADTVYWLALFTNAAASFNITCKGTVNAVPYWIANLTDAAYIIQLYRDTTYGALPDPAGALSGLGSGASSSLSIRVRVA